MKTLALDQAVQIAAKGPEEFFQHVTREVLSRLVSDGTLNGEIAGDEITVIDDDTFRGLMAYGVEEFVYNLHGFSFVAVKAPIESIAATLSRHPLTTAYKDNQLRLRVQKDAEISAEPGKRHAFLVQPKRSDWCILLNTVHWLEPGVDAELVMQLAAELSAAHTTRSIAAWDDDIAGSTAVIFENGEELSTISDSDDQAEFFRLFYEEGLALQQVFITAQGEEAQLLARRPAKITRADYICLKALADTTADIAAPSNEINSDARLTGDTPLMVAVREGNIAEVQALLAAGADPNATDMHGANALHHCNHTMTPELVSLLINAGVNANLQAAHSGETPLHNALKNRGWYDEKRTAAIVELLINAGADPNAPDKNGNSPLRLLADRSELPAVKVLIQFGADINVKDAQGRTPAEYARQWGDPEVADYLESLTTSGKPGV